MLHGCTHDAEDMAEISGMNEVAAANQFLVVYPEQSRMANLLKCWNWFHPKHQTRDAGEPSILAAVVDNIQSTYNVDPDRVYVVGVSAGGAPPLVFRGASTSIRRCHRRCHGNRCLAGDMCCYHSSQNRALPRLGNRYALRVQGTLAALHPFLQRRPTRHGC
jgi:hypothetical protein